MDSKLRFSSRVSAYKAGRPGYPKEVFEMLKTICEEDFSVADIGAGTGIFSKGLLEHGFDVKAVEPNKEMREGMTEDLGEFDHFEVYDGSAEKTGIADAGVNLITAAQAFHWFDRDKAREEFRRILKPGGQVALIWNDRLWKSSQFMEAYEILLRNFGTDYSQVEHRNIHPAAIARFFGRSGCRLITFSNSQVMSYEDLLNRLNSTSYAPGENSPIYSEMMNCVNSIFQHHQKDGTVRFDYETLVYFGEIMD